MSTRESSPPEPAIHYGHYYYLPQLHKRHTPFLSEETATKLYAHILANCIEPQYSTGEQLKKAAATPQFWEDIKHHYRLHAGLLAEAYSEGMRHVSEK